MFPLIRIDKRVPSGSIWQARRAYLLPAVDGWTRVYGPPGTRWSNPVQGWTARDGGISLFHPERPFTIACYGPDGAQRFYIDIAHGTVIGGDRIEFVDLFLDVMIDGDHVVSEKDEHQLVALPHELGRFARSARDEVRRLITRGDALFDRGSRYFSVPDGVSRLPPAIDPLDLG